MRKRFLGDVRCPVDLFDLGPAHHQDSRIVPLPKRPGLVPIHLSAAQNHQGSGFGLWTGDLAAHFSGRQREVSEARKQPIASIDRQHNVISAAEIREAVTTYCETLNASNWFVFQHKWSWKRKAAISVIRWHGS